jgi:threonine dehydrogenase-like Zn-dependent dehydrogenase
VFATWYRTRWLLEHGVVDLRPLITQRYGLAEFERAFAELESGAACKIILDPAPPDSTHSDALEEVAVS